MDEIGTLRPDPSAPNTFMKTAYIPVIRPILSGKFILMIPGINTFPIAIASPMKSVPANKKPIPEIDLTAIPIMSKTRDKAIVHSMPIRFAIFGADGESKANASKGNVVIEHASALLIPWSSRINEKKVPTEVSGTLKLVPTKSKLISNNQLSFLVLYVLPGISVCLFILLLHHHCYIFFQCFHITFNICSCCVFILFMNCFEKLYVQFLFIRKRRINRH